MLELFLGCQSRTSIMFRCIFAALDHLWFFLAEECGTTFVTPVRVHRKYHISMYFLRKVISHFLPKEKISCFREKKNAIFPDNTRKIMSQRPFLKIPSFQKVWSHVSVYFFEKDDLSRQYKKDHIPAWLFWKDHLFRTSGKRKYGFPCSVNHSSRKLGVTSNMLRGYYNCKLGQTNYLLVSKKVSGSWKINIFIDY